MELEPVQDGKAFPFGADRSASFDAAQPLLLVALLMILCGMVLWQETPKPVLQVKAADSLSSVAR